MSYHGQLRDTDNRVVYTFRDVPMQPSVWALFGRQKPVPVLTHRGKVYYDTGDYDRVGGAPFRLYAQAPDLAASGE